MEISHSEYNTNKSFTEYIKLGKHLEILLSVYCLCKQTVPDIKCFMLTKCINTCIFIHICKLIKSERTLTIECQQTYSVYVLNVINVCVCFVLYVTKLFVC